MSFPRSTLSRVDLPDPLGPMTAMRDSRSTPRSTVSKSRRGGPGAASGSAGFVGKPNDTRSSASTGRPRGSGLGSEKRNGASCTTGGGASASIFSSSLMRLCTIDARLALLLNLSTNS